MKTFKYTALTKDGTRSKGVIQGTDEYEAAAKIRQNYPIVEEISEVRPRLGAGNAILSMEVGGDTIKKKPLSIACSQIAITLQSGIPLARCLELIGNQTEDKTIRKLLLTTAEDVAEGAPLAASLERNGRKLPATFIETIRAGEESGNIERSFTEMARYYENAYKTADKIKSALSYPVFVVVIAIIVMVVVMVYVVPTLASTFVELGGDLPVMTQILISTSDFMARWWVVMAIVILLIVLGWKLYCRTEQGMNLQAKLQLNMPILGNIRILSDSAEFANTMSMLLKSGLTVNHAVEVTAKTLNNYILRQRTAAIVGRIEEGRSLGECMLRLEEYPKTLREMCSIGEETGELDQTLEVIGKFYTSEADNATKDALAKLEPTLLVLLAVFAGYIVISIYLPMFTMYNLF